LSNGPAVSSRFLGAAIFIVLTAASACDPNVLIGERWLKAGGAAGEPGAAGLATGGGGSSAGSSVAGSGGSEAGDTGRGGSATNAAGEAGAGGAPPDPERWCATAPWLNKPVVFIGPNGKVIPPGSYVVTYVGGAQKHDGKIGYEVTGHYFGKNGILAGHHIFSGSSPETGTTSVWLEDTGLIPGDSVEDVEQSNRGHTWPLQHTGGELSITLYDDVYEDNLGPGTQLCISAAP
jgi:hypothetical protein